MKTLLGARKDSTRTQILMRPKNRLQGSAVDARVDRAVE